MENVKIVILSNSEVLISQIEEVSSEMGEPDCKLLLPYSLNKYSDNSITLDSWISEYTSQDYVMIHSDKILTIVDPKNEILEKYKLIIA